ncbi:hypothetical protein [Neobacillus sp. SuZ13]|uniref:hypothetical protein n=1 Tax=Neobacillus sp. SuZ13 TaxID=3047875 RepID=UPI0024BFF49B|nr:hypothetical protein [Neobacillus sp. SuZ13]WHY64619.1 hypothetical protein QNH17_15950 [Neobacillus sp. SuZ13]
MGHMIQRLKERMNKYFLILLATTILLGVIGWLLPVGQEKSSYTLETTLTLGNYDNPDLNDPRSVIILLTETPFVEEHLNDLWEEKFEQIGTNLQVTAGPGKIINLSYTDHSEESTAKVLNKITRAFMKLDKEQFDKKQKFIQDYKKTITSEEVGPEAKADQQRFIYELNTALFDMKPAKLLKPADINAINTENRAFNSKERAVLGILLGVTLSFLWIVFPVIFKEQSFE